MKMSKLVLVEAERDLGALRDTVPGDERLIDAQFAHQFNVILARVESAGYPMKPFEL